MQASIENQMDFMNGLHFSYLCTWAPCDGIQPIICIYHRILHPKMFPIFPISTKFQRQLATEKKTKKK